jgi:hypothetical protein
MRFVNIQRVDENLRSGTSIRMRMMKTIVNAIQASEAATTDNGRADIAVRR